MLDSFLRTAFSSDDDPLSHIYNLSYGADFRSSSSNNHASLHSIRKLRRARRICGWANHVWTVRLRARWRVHTLPEPLGHEYVSSPFEDLSAQLTAISSGAGVGSQNSTLISASGDTVSWETVWTWANNENNVKSCMCILSVLDV